MSTPSVAPNPLREGLVVERVPEPCAMVIFGASGDLTKRKLIPALYSLYRDRLLPHAFSVVGYARRPLPEFVSDMRKATDEFARRRPVDEAVWSSFAEGISYVTGEFHDLDAYYRLKAHLEEIDKTRGTQGNRVFYLSVPPSYYPVILEMLGKAGLISDSTRPFTRVIIEKPFGRDLESARALNKTAASVLREDQTFRIDHYLGKETVQNIFVLRFANAMFEPLWNAKYIDHVQLTVAEAIGVEGRGGYFEEAGIVRDMVQNHMFQFLTLMAMEPPNAFEANAVRDEKCKVLRALRPFSLEDVAKSVVRGQYVAGSSMGTQRGGYKDEKGVKPDSKTETYVAMKLHIDNWRWSGVPFYLRAGKALPKRVTEIAIQFKSPPPLYFGGAQKRASKTDVPPNVLAIRIQPDEGISLKFVSKVPGQTMEVLPVAMEFRYGTSFGAEPPEAYERLLLDCMLGDSTLYTRGDEAEASWTFIDRVFQGWAAENAPPVETYEFGTWGPDAADEPRARRSCVEATVSGELEAFSAGQSIPVPLSSIEKELASLWRLASKQDGGRTTVTRACLWNLIVRTVGEENFHRAKDLVDAVSPTLPARVLVLKTDRSAATALPRAWIEANWHSVGGGGRQIGSEELTLEANGNAIDDLAPMVRALLVPDVPTAALWCGSSPRKESALDVELLRAADRIIVGDDGERDLQSLANLLARDARIHAEPIALGWLRTAAWRQLLASLFDPPSPANDVFAVERVEIACPPARAGSALLFIGWLASRLGWRNGHRTSAGSFGFDRDNGRVVVHVASVAGAPDPFATVQLFTTGGEYSLERDAATVILNTPSLAHRAPLVELTDAELWLASLSGAGRDPLFVEALQRAASLASP